MAPYRLDGPFWEELRGSMHLVQRIYLAGGEPFLQPLHRPLLDMLIQGGVAPDIELVYNSNLTVLPPDVLERLAAFRSVEIGASCDGVEEVYERIRIGARWSVFVANVRRARKHAHVWLQAAPQRDNVRSLGRLVDWAIGEGLAVDMTNLVHHPERLSVGALEGREREEAADDLRRWIVTYESSGHARVATDLRGVLALLLSGGTGTAARGQPDSAS